MLVSIRYKNIAYHLEVILNDLQRHLGLLFPKKFELFDLFWITTILIESLSYPYHIGLKFGAPAVNIINTTQICFRHR